MWNEPTKKQLEKIPKLYSQDGVPKLEKKVYMKFFIGNWRWYITEIDKKHELMFAYVVSPIEPEGNFGYVSLPELKSIKKGFLQIDREIYQVNPYQPKKLGKLLKEDGVL